jgi:hypothetical protein
MNLVKSIIVGLAVTALSYFFLFAVTLIAINLVPVIKFIAIGLGCWAMYYFNTKYGN